MSAYLYITELNKELDELEDYESDQDMADYRDPDRLTALRKLRDDMEGTWQDILHHGGDGLIPEDEWTDYARQTAEDLGLVNVQLYEWPLSHLDWDAAADALKSDYYSVTFEGTDYYYREP